MKFPAQYISPLPTPSPPLLPLCLTQSKSPLWTHLMAYAEKFGKKEFDVGASPVRTPPPKPYPLTSSLSSLSHISTSGQSQSDY